jgi:hypothetical protein
MTQLIRPAEKETLITLSATEAGDINDDEETAKATDSHKTGSLKGLWTESGSFSYKSRYSSCLTATECDPIAGKS